MTTQEYLSTPETVQPQELINGVLVVRDSPSPSHQAVVAAMFLALHAHLQEQRSGTIWLSPLDVILDDDRALVVQPDLFYVSSGRQMIVGEHVVGAPDLVIEVLSPRPRKGDLGERLGWFAEYGVRECWLVHQRERRLDMVTFADGRVRAQRSFSRADSLQSAVLPAFTASLDLILGY